MEEGEKKNSTIGFLSFSLFFFFFILQRIKMPSPNEFLCILRYSKLPFCDSSHLAITTDMQKKDKLIVSTFSK